MPLELCPSRVLLMVFVLPRVHLPTPTRCTAEGSSGHSKHGLLAWSLGVPPCRDKQPPAGEGRGQCWDWWWQGLVWDTCPGHLPRLCPEQRHSPGPALLLPQVHPRSSGCARTLLRAPPAHSPPPLGTGVCFARAFLGHIPDSSSGGERSLRALPPGDALC